jgi:hypothetical protein
MYKVKDDFADDDYEQFSGGSDSEPELDPNNKNDNRNKYADDMKNHSTGITDGIAKDRCCTDIICLVLFFIFIGAMGYATMYGYKNG